jgi:hypothetical protein
MLAAARGEMGKFASIVLEEPILSIEPSVKEWNRGAGAVMHRYCFVLFRLNLNAQPCALQESGVCKFGNIHHRTSSIDVYPEAGFPECSGLHAPTTRKPLDLWLIQTK